MADKHWRYKTEEEAEEMRDTGLTAIVISEDDKNYVKEHILPVYCNIHSEIVAKQIDYTIRWIVKADFPEEWPNLCEVIREYINSEDLYDSKVFVGLYTLKSVCKCYEYQFQSRRGTLYEIVEELFPRLEEIANLVQSDNSDRGCQLKNVIGQCFYTANQLSLCPRYQNSESLDALVAFFKTCLEDDIDEHLTAKTDSIAEIDERIKSQQWILKETWMHFLFRIFQKYGNPDFCDEHSKPIAEHCQENYTEGLIELAFGLISKTNDFYIYAKVVTYWVKIMVVGIGYPVAMKYIKQYLESIFSTYLIPLLYLTEKDVEDFEWDPIEFVRKTKDSSESFYSSRSASLELITQVTRFKTDREDEKAVPDYLEHFFQYIVTTLEEYLKQEGDDYRVKDALLLTIGQMAPTLIRYEAFHEPVEHLLKEYIFPDFQSKNEIFRYRAWWMYGEFARLNMEYEHCFEAAKCLFESMNDDHLPIKITASSSLYRILRKKELKESFKSELSRILEAYLTLMDDIDNDELISGLEEIVGIYDDCIEPFALELCQKVVESYLKVASKETDEVFGQMDMAASALVNTVKWVLESVKGNAELLLKIEAIIFPMVVNTLTPAGLECLDDAIECMTLIMYSTQTATNRMWSLFPQMLKVVVGTSEDEEGGYAFDYLTSFEDYIKNLMVIGNEDMLKKTVGDVPIMTVLIKSILRILQISKTEIGDLDAYIWISLVNTLLERFPGKLDNILLLFVKILASELNNKKISKSYRLHVLLMVPTLFSYNPVLTLKIFHETKIMIPVLQHFFSSLRKYREDTEQHRICIYGVSKLILDMEVEHMPDMIKSSIPKIIDSLMTLMHKYLRERTREKIEELDECIKEGEEETEENQNRKRHIDHLREILLSEEPTEPPAEEEKDEDDDLDDDYLWSRTDSFYYKSKYENLEAPLYFRDLLQKCKEQKEELYNHVLGVIPEEKQGFLDELIQRAEYIQSLN